MNEADYEAWCRREPCCIEWRSLGDGRYLMVHRLLFHYTLILGDIGDMIGYVDRWCFYGCSDALEACRTWDGKGDPPQAWHKHPATGRWKVDGVVYEDAFKAEEATGRVYISDRFR